MRCPQCGFHSFDYLDACKKCNTDLRPYKANKGVTATIAPASPSPTPLEPSPAPTFKPSPPPSTPFGIPPGINLEEAKAAPPASPMDDILAPPTPAAGTPEAPGFTLDFGSPGGEASLPTLPPLDLVTPPPASASTPSTESLSLITPPLPAAPPAKPVTREIPAPSVSDLLSAPRGGFWIRFAAQIVDGFILTVMIGLILIILFFTTNLKRTLLLLIQDPGIAAARLKALGMVINIYILVLNFFYYTYFHGAKGQTPGKKLFKLKVIQANGQKMTYGKALLRYLGYIVNQFTLMIGFLWAAFDREKQGLHDKIAGTLVVRLR